jgi:hypothetical protein
MNLDFRAGLESGQIPVAAVLLWYTVAYVVFIAMGALPSEKFPGRKRPAEVLRERALFFLAFFAAPIIVARSAGFELPGMAFLGLGESRIGTEFVSSAGNAGLPHAHGIRGWIIPTLLLSVPAGAVGLLARKSRADIKNYPQYMPEKWTGLHLAAEVASWSIYLVAYEFAFRAVLLDSLLPAGPWIAAAASTLAYALAHLPKSRKEAASAVVFGMVTSILTLLWGSIWPAFFLHLVLALGNDMACADSAGRPE